VKGVDVGVLRRDKHRNFWYSMCKVPTLWLLPQYEEAKGVGVGVSQRDKRHDFWWSNINQIYVWRLQYVYSTNITTTTLVQADKGSRCWRLAEGQKPWFLALRCWPNFTISVCSMCTVPILRLLPQYEEVNGVGVGVSRWDKRRDFWNYNIDLFTIRRCKTEVQKLS